MLHPQHTAVPLPLLTEPCRCRHGVGSTAWHGAAWHCMAWRSMAQHGTVWLSMAWHSMAQVQCEPGQGRDGTTVPALSPLLGWVWVIAVLSHPCAHFIGENGLFFTLIKP